MVDTTSITWLGLGTLAVLGLWLYMEKKKNPNLEWGQVFLLSLTRYNITWFTGIAIFINIAEAMLAASIIPSGEGIINSTSRYFGHLSISVVSILGALTLVKEVTLFIASFSPFSFKALLVRFLRVCLALVATFVMPALNTLLIANGLKETAAIKLLWASLFQSNERYMYLLAKSGNDISYEPFDGLSYIMMATVVVNFAHLLIILWDALVAMDPGSKELGEAMIVGKKAEEKGKKGDDKKKSEDKPDEEQGTGDSKNVVLETIEELIRFYGLDETQIKSKALAAKRLMEAQQEKTRGQIAKALGTVMEDKVVPFQDKVKSGKISGDAEKAEREKIREAIAEVFRASVKDGKGLGMSLPKPKN